MIRERTATITPKVSVLRMANVACQKRSCPRELVPNQYSAEGGRSGGTRYWSSGSTGDTKLRHENATMKRHQEQTDE